MSDPSEAMGNGKPTVLVLDASNVRYLLRVEHGSYPRHETLAECRMSSEDMCEFVFPNVFY